MNLLQSVVYGFVSGLSEFVPASSHAHQLIMLKLFGAQTDPVMNFFIHIAVLVALYMGARNLFDAFMRERRVSIRRTRRVSSRSNYLYPFIRTASITLVIVYACFTYIFGREFSLLNVSIFSLINCIVLFIPERLIHSNKTAQHMTTFDSIIMGLFGACSAFPGISRIGFANAYAVGRGADRQHAFNWTLIISIPAILLMIVIDFIGIFSGALPLTLMRVLSYILAAGFAYFGAYLGVSLMKLLSVKLSHTTFSYYSLGVALFTFVLYLI